MTKKITLSVLLVFIAVFVSGCSLTKLISEKISSLTGAKKTIEQITQTTGGAGGVAGTIQDILKSGKNLKCAAQVTNEDGTVSVESYVSGNKFRTDSVNTNSSSEKVTFHMISDGQWAYMWGDDGQPGQKMQFSEFEGNKDTTAEQQNTSIRDALKNYEFKCTPWLLVDQSKFAAPTNVEFQDLTEMMKQLQNNAPEISKDLCKTCDSIEDAATKQDCTKLNCQ